MSKKIWSLSDISQPLIIAILLLLPGMTQGILSKEQMIHDMVMSGSAKLPKTVMKLHLMPDKGLKGMGAVCLDGSDAGFYFKPAPKPTNMKDWQLHFKGAGWCYDKLDCWGRSNGQFGSSRYGGQFSNTTTGWNGGILSDDCNYNPDFCNFNKVILLYCDGNSFTGNRDSPVIVKGLDGKDKPLYFRGRRILDAILMTLASDHGLSSAENVLLTGCSSGGLAAYLHADYVHEKLRELAPQMMKFRVSPVSGFFLLHNTVDGKPVYPTQMKNIFHLANSTYGVNDKCITAMPDTDKWKCNFAQEAYAYTDSLTFPINSALDSWQTGCIYTAELEAGFPNQTDTRNGICYATPGWKNCSSNPETCTASQMTVMNKYITDFVNIVQGTKTYKGGFVYSCHSHCAGIAGGWSYKINGVSMQQAVSKWWNSAGSDPPSQHSYMPCHYKTTSPHKCNPTCPN